MQPHGLQHIWLPCPSSTPGAYSNSSHCVVMPFNHLILCQPLIFLPSICPSIRIFSNKSALRIRWPKYWSFSFSISPSNEYSGSISFRMDWLDPLEEHFWRRKWQPTPVFLPGESQGWGSLVGRHLWGRTESDTTEATLQQHQRINAFELWCWRRLLSVPWTARSNQSILKEINPEYSLEGLMLKLKLQYFGHLM